MHTSHVKCLATVTVLRQSTVQQHYTSAVSSCFTNADVLATLSSMDAGSGRGQLGLSSAILHRPTEER